jgi:hypothetical protein
MGVVRDVTVDNLVTAVGNIDTSSLAQDSTLQDVVTAIGNISGGSDPVTNTTVNSLCKDTTGQSIASAISGLGQTLGSDKANIDGSNIANPSAFRSNIGLQIDTFSFSGSANSWYNIVTDCPLNEYIPLGFIGSSLSRINWTYNFLYDGNTSSTYWAVRITSPLVSTPSGTYSGRFLALKIN